MKAVLMTAVGGPEVLKLAEVPAPVISTDTQLLVKIRAAGINPVDYKQRGRGTWYPSSPPQILGLDGAGVVEEAGPGVTRFKWGDAVYFAHGGVGKKPGNYAEYVLIEERFAVKKPEKADFIEAAAAPVVLITAWESLFDRANLKKGQSVLIHGGSGGVGHVAVQLAAAHGVRAIATATGARKKEIVEKLGADTVVIAGEEDFVQKALDFTDGRGVDAAVDTVGGTTFYRTFSCIRFYGTLVSLLSPQPENADWTQARLRCVYLSNELMLTPWYFDLIEAEKLQTTILENCAALIDEGRLKILVHKTFPLEEAAEAHRELETGHPVGKIVLRIED